MMKLSALLLVLLSVGFHVSADPPAIPPGQAKYVVVLWIPGTPDPRDHSKRVKNVPEPDVTQLGGTELKRNANVRVILLPKKAIKQLRKHEAVAYVQRIWMGEPLDDWDDEVTATAQRSKFATESDTNINWSKDYTYDGSGNIKTLGDDAYSYDTANRLIRETVNGQIETFTYDQFGNLTERAVAGAPAVTIPVDAASNRLTGLEYDAAGNVTTRDGRVVYTYDSLNRMSYYDDPNGTDRRLIYDANDEQIGRATTDNSVWTIRDFDGQVLREFRGDDISGIWIWEADYIRAGGQVIAGERQAFALNDTATIIWGGKRHYHLDHLGSVRAVTNEAGYSVAENDFYAFGSSQTASFQEFENPNDMHVDTMRFAGHTRDFLGYMNVESPDYIDYMHARYYDPHLGRFLSVDPGKDWDPKQPQSWNMYAYVRNSPLNSVDPDGRLKEDANGNIVFVPTGKGVEKYAERKNIGNGQTATVTWPVQVGYITTDSGTQIPASRPTGPISVTIEDADGNITQGGKELLPGLGDRADNSANCHGTTFAKGQVWIDNTLVPAVLAGDGFKPISRPKIGAVGVYTNNEHSVTVTNLPHGGWPTTVYGKGGITPAMTTTPEGGWHTGVAPAYYKRDE